MRLAHSFKLNLLPILLLAGVFATIPALAQTTSTWTGGAGNWAPCPGQGGNALWDTCGNAKPAYPTGNANAVIDGGPVTLAAGNGISIVGLTVSSGETLFITPGYLNITGTSITNNGIISIGASNGLGIQGSATVTLNGGGTVNMTSANAKFYGANGSPTLINQQTIQGNGALGLGLNLTNQGVVNANTGTIGLQPTAATNTGTLEASTGSTLAFTNGTATPYNNTGGVIQALDGGTVQLDNGVYTGGTLTTLGTGVVQATHSAVLNGLTNSGTLQVPTGQNATLENTINNTGTIQLPSSTLAMSGNVTVSGSGSVLMTGSATLQQLTSTGNSLTNRQLIHGSGTFLQLPLINKGTVAADIAASTLALSGGAITNTANLQASGGGTLELGTIINNTGGKIQALNGSTVLLTNNFNGSVNGGFLTTAGTGIIKAQNALLDGTVNVPTNSGRLSVASTDLFLQGKINNTGSITLTGLSCVILNQPTTLTGTGRLNMASSTCIFGAGLAFINQSTIVGAGSIGDSNPMPITNNGTISANQTAPLTIVPDNSGFTNTGLLSVSSGSTMNINGTFNNLSGGVLSGGRYSVAGTLTLPNTISTNAANITLTGPTAQIISNSTAGNALAPLTTNGLTGVLTIQSGQILTTAGNLSNAGHIAVKTASRLKLGGSYTQTAGTITVDGTLTAPSGLGLQKGSVAGQGTLAAAITSNATVITGDSTTKAGKLTVTGSYTQNTTGVLDVAIGGTQVGTQYSQLAVSNGVSLIGGTLNIKRINSFVPALADSFTILTGSAITGKFASVNGLSINSTEHFDVNYSSTAVTLTVASGP